MALLRSLRNLGRMLFSRAPKAPEVDVAQTRRLQQEGAVVLDVREGAEWRGGHVPGALHIPLAQLEDRLDEVPKDRPVVVHCALGTRGAFAAKRLGELGVKDVRNLRGGLRAWKSAGQPLETPDDAPR